MMSEQLSDAEDRNSQSTIANSTEVQEQEEFWSWKTMSQYARELICFLAFFLTTYATFQNRTQKFARPPSPSYLFDKTSMVQEYSDGQLGVIQTQVASSELSLVFFYAPWCAESHYAKNIIEILAKQFSDEVYFAAVNCWQPGGECKIQYPRVDSWPILMAYYPKGLAVQYNGLWNLKSVATFIDKLLNPLQRIETKEDLLKAKFDNFATLVGFFPSTQHPLASEKYQIFFQMSIKSLEYNTLNGIEFAVVTGETIERLNKTSSNPTIEMHLLNTTLVYDESLWSIDGISNWVKKNLEFENIWVEISGKKSWNLSQRLKKTPMLFMFYPKHYGRDYDDAYYMLREVALTYNDCRLNRSFSDIRFVKFLREESLRQKLNLKLKCLQLKESRQQKQHVKPSEICNITEFNVFALKNSNIYNYCPCNRKVTDQSSYSVVNKWPNNIEEEKKKLQWYSHNEFLLDDNKSPSYLLSKSLNYKCWKLSLPEHYSRNITYQEINKNFTGFGCKYNRSLSFVMADSDLYNYMIKSLGVNLHFQNTTKAFVFIVDKQKESIFKLKGEISMSSMTNFIEKFHNNSLVRNLRKKSLQHQIVNDTIREVIYSKEINSKQLKEIIKLSNQNTVVLFYSSQCALCNIFSRTIINIGKILKSANINFFRIDGENNDFSWEYTMESFPTLLVIPKSREADAKIYPRNLEISRQNVLRFILKSLSSIDRLRLLLEICQQFQVEDLLPSCMNNFRIAISNCISNNLQKWRNNISNSYSNIMKRLQILHKIYYLSFRINRTNNLKAITDNIVIIENL